MTQSAAWMPPGSKVGPRPGRARRAISMVLAVLAGVLLLGWAVGRAASDRWVWSQYLSWVPTPALGATASVLLAASWGFVWRIGGTAGRARLLALAGVVLLAGWVLLFEWRLTNALRRGPGAGVPSLRVLNWNVSAIEREEQVIAPVLAQAPDVAVLVNPHSGVRWGQVFDALSASMPHRASELGMIVLSRDPVIRWGGTWLSLPEPVDESGKLAPGGRFDPGRAMYVELDTRATLGRPTTLWVIDMPSDERLGRWALAQRAAAAIASWKGPERHATDTGAAAITPSSGFPPPDLIVGDFNIPRGSASLSLMTRGLENAFDQAGYGWVRSWPRVRPVFHIDQTFVGRNLRAWRYDVVDPTFGNHRLQVANLTAGP